MPKSAEKDKVQVKKQKNEKIESKIENKENKDNKENKKKDSKKTVDKNTNNKKNVKNSKEIKTNKNNNKEDNKKDNNNKKIEKQSEKKENKNSDNKNAKNKEDAKLTEEINDNKNEANESLTEEKEHAKLIKFEEIKNIFKRKKAIPKEDLKEINKPVFYNILVAIIVLVYFIFLILGFNNIEKNVYQTDLKVFSMCILFLAIILLEKAYKKDSGTLAIYGIETIVIAIITLALIYVEFMASANYINIVLTISYILAIYYVIKSIIIYIRRRKKYFVNNMKDMINTDE